MKRVIPLILLLLGGINSVKGIMGLNRVLGGIFENNFHPKPPLELSEEFKPENLQYHGTTTIAFVHKDCVVVAVDSMASIGSYVGSRTVNKIIPISKCVVGTMAGGAADCAHWISRLAAQVQVLEYEWGCCPSPGAIARLLASSLAEMRGSELSIGTMICGCDNNGPSVHYVDSDGHCVPGNMFCVGSGGPLAYSVLDHAWDDLQTWSLDEVADYACTALLRAAQRDCYSGGYLNVMVVNATGCYHIRRIDSRRLKKTRAISTEI